MGASQDKSNQSDNSIIRNDSIKKIIRTTAIQTLMPQLEDDRDSNENRKKSENINGNRELTELEELDLYYDFDYVPPNIDEYDRPPSRSLFYEESSVEL